MTENGSMTLCYPYPQADISGQIKLFPEDFKVNESLGFELSGSGEHLFLYVQKQGLTTPELIEQLSNSVGIHPRQLGYSGLKDKQAVTQQWISLHLPGIKQTPEIPATDNYQILRSHWHDKKLRVGVHQSNDFDITVRNIQGNPGDLQQIIKRLQQHGFANYFGVQRFGRQRDNVFQALKVLTNRHKSKRLGRHRKSLYLSSLRSELFNRILCRRIQLGIWDNPVNGDLYMLAGSQSLFNAALDEEILQRYAQCDIHSALSLYGCGDSKLSEQALQIENEVLTSCPEIRDTLLKHEIKRSYRSNRAVPKRLRVSYQPQENIIRVRVELGKGVYLTSLLNHFVTIEPNKVSSGS